MVLRVPTAYLSEYADTMNEAFDLNMNVSQVSKFFASRDINRKKV